MKKFNVILLSLFLVAAIFGPRLVFAKLMNGTHSCHQTPAEMSVACAVHCFSKAVAETEVEVAPAPSLVFSFPKIVDFVLPELIFESTIFSFFEDQVFRDPLVILTTIKRE